MAESVVQEGKTLEELEKEITCSVCQEHYTEPKVLPCLHYYCKECVLRLAPRTASNKPFSCPECCKETILPEGGVEELRTAFFINRLKSNFSALKRVHGKIEVRCEGCNSGSKAEAFCCHCAVFICKDCVLSHKKLKVFSSHEVASLEDLKQGRAKQIAVAEPATKKCSIHEEPLLIYCYDCDSLICRDCTVIDHRDHKFQFSKLEAPAIKESLLEALAPFQEITTKLSNAVKDVCTTKHEVEAQSASILGSIETSFQRLFDILERRKKELEEEVSEKVHDKVKKLSAQEKELSLDIAKVHSIVEYTERFIGHCSDNEVMSMHTDIRRQIKREIEEHRKSGRSLEPVEEADVGVEVRCEEELQQLYQTKAKVTQLGVDPAWCIVSGEGAESAEVHQTAEVTLTTRLSNNKTTRRSTEVVSELKSLYNGSVMKCNVDQSGPGEYRIQYTPTVRGRHELTVSVDGQQVAGSPFPVFVSISPTQLGKPVKVWVNIMRPRGITTNSENNVIVVGDKRNIVMFDKTGEKKILVTRSESQLTELEGIATDSEDNIYCTDFKSNKIMKCDKNGSNVQVYEVYQVAGPGYSGVAVVGDEVMLCERFNKGNIMIYDRELKYKRRIQRDSEKNFLLVSCDVHGNLYCISDKVQVFSNDGVFLRSFGCDSNGVNRLQNPYYVCVSGCYVYVTNFGCHNVSVFTTSGDYVTSFGQHGRGVGDFYGPYGVCVDKDGFVHVADLINNRIQNF